MRSALSLSIAIGNECTADINVLENFIEFPKQFIETNVSPRWNLDRKIMSKRSWLDICTRVEDTSSNSATYTEFIEERVNVLKESSSDKFERFQWFTITGTTRMENGKCVINSRTFARGSIHSMNVNLPTWCWSVFSQNPKFKHDDGRGWSDKGSTKTR